MDTRMVLKIHIGEMGKSRRAEGEGSLICVTGVVP